jgi:hypothetical protein
MFVVPLHRLTEEDGAGWVGSAEFIRGVPENVPPVLTLPPIAQVLDAFRRAGCHGANWFQIVGEDAGTRLPDCPGPGPRVDVGGMDLGEVSVYVAGQASSLPAVAADAPMAWVAFRKPNPAAVLRAVCALALLAGPQLVFDESADVLFVVWPGEDPDGLESEWPW